MTEVLDLVSIGKEDIDVLFGCLRDVLEDSVVTTFKNKLSRVGKMLVGNVSINDEAKLFEFLWRIESQVLIDKSDPLGCSKNT